MDTIPLNNLLASHFIEHDANGNEKYSLLNLDKLPHYNYLNEMINALGKIFSSDVQNESNIYKRLKEKKWGDNKFNDINNRFSEIFNYNDPNVRSDDKHSPSTFRETLFKMIENSFDPYYSIFVDNGDDDGEYEIHDGKHRAVIKKFLYDLNNEYANKTDIETPLVIRSILKNLKESNDSLPVVKMRVKRSPDKVKEKRPMNVDSSHYGTINNSWGQPFRVNHTKDDENGREGKLGNFL
jgi:hypothetical protein